MTRLGSYSGDQVVRAFKEAGWRFSRQKGSHIILERIGDDVTLSIPVHQGKDVKRSTLRDFIRDAGMTIVAVEVKLALKRKV